VATLLEIRELKAAYARACNTLRSLEVLGKDVRESEKVTVIHDPVARRIERQRRDVRELEQRLIKLGCEASIAPLSQPEEVFRDARYF